jgi:hypothetical protein
VRGAAVVESRPDSWEHQGRQYHSTSRILPYFIEGQSMIELMGNVISAIDLFSFDSPGIGGQPGLVVVSHSYATSL